MAMACFCDLICSGFNSCCTANTLACEYKQRQELSATWEDHWRSHPWSGHISGPVVSSKTLM